MKNPLKLLFRQNRIHTPEPIPETSPDEIKEIDVFAEDEQKKPVSSRNRKHNSRSTDKVSDTDNTHVITFTMSEWIRLSVGQLALSEKRGVNISKRDFLSEAIDLLLENNDIDFITFLKKHSKK